VGRAKVLFISIRFYLFSLYLKLRQGLNKERKNSIELKFTPNLSFQNKFQSDRELLTWLKLNLPGTPYWFGGHCHLVELALANREWQLGYGSALAADTLARSSAQKEKAKFLVSCCQLAAGDYSTAEKSLISLLDKNPENLKYREQLGAAYFAQQQFLKAHDCLELLPVELRSAPVHSALAYIKQQIHC